MWQRIIFIIRAYWNHWFCNNKTKDDLEDSIDNDEDHSISHYDFVMTALKIKQQEQEMFFAREFDR